MGSESGDEGWLRVNKDDEIRGHGTSPLRLRYSRESPRQRTGTELNFVIDVHSARRVPLHLRPGVVPGRPRAAPPAPSQQGSNREPGRRHLPAVVALGEKRSSAR